MRRLLVIVLACCSMAAVSPRDTVADAIQHTAPWMSRVLAVAYSKAMREAATEGGFDPLLGVALVWHESEWRATAESPDGEDVGLAQVRARYIGACRYDEEPVKDPSTDCLREREKLRDGIYSIGLIGDRIKSWRKLCRSKTGRASERHWLSGLGGYDNHSQGTWCGQRQDNRGQWLDRPTPLAVAQVLACRQCLLKPKCQCSRKPPKTRPRSTGARSGSPRGKSTR